MEPIFSAGSIDFLVTDIFLQEGIIHFSGTLSTGTDFDCCEMYNKK